MGAYKRRKVEPGEPAWVHIGSLLAEGDEHYNFVCDAAALYAQERIDAKRNERALTINPTRLRRNMLSSTVCFNLFSDLRKAVFDDPPAAATAVRAMLPEEDVGHGR